MIGTPEARSGRTAALWTAAAATFLLAGAGLAFRDRLVEEYCLWKLESGREGERERAADALGEMRSWRALPALIEAAAGGVDVESDLIAAEHHADAIAKILGGAGQPQLPRGSTGWDSRRGVKLSALSELADSRGRPDVGAFLVKAGNERSAIGACRILTTVNEQYRVRFRSYAASLASLSAERFIDDVLGSGTKSGYRFSYSGGPNAWAVTADPTMPGTTGDRHFFVEQSGVIRSSSTGTATATSSPID